MHNIALDVMGGDFAPDEILEGALLALKEYNISLTLLGPKDLIESKLTPAFDKYKKRITVVHAPDIVTMAESPSVSFRKKKDSSIRVGMNLLKEKKTEAFISAGNTGAVLTAGLLTLGRINGVDRPGIAAVLPSKKGPVVMMDMGSSVDCKPNHLFQFAIMGECLAKSVLGVENPRVGLLNIGEEEDKGDQLALATFDLLKEQNIFHFSGNVEGKEILKGNVDVVVCDGFVGNSLLKFGEGVSSLFLEFFKTEAKQSLLSLIGLMFLRPALKRFGKKFDYDEYGGAPLLGVNECVIIAHGSAKRKAIKNAIHTALVTVENKMVEKIAAELKA